MLNWTSDLSVSTHVCSSYQHWEKSGIRCQRWHFSNRTLSSLTDSGTIPDNTACGKLSMASTWMDLETWAQAQRQLSYSLISLDPCKLRNGDKSILASLLVETWLTLLIAWSSRLLMAWGHLEPLRQLTLLSLSFWFQHRATAISLKPIYRPIRLFYQPASFRSML